jgi:hypothetical protein
MAEHHPGQGSASCRYTDDSGRCGSREIDGLEYCLHHVPDDMLEEAESITGIIRCRHDFGQPDACRHYAVKDTVPPRCHVHGAGKGSVPWKQAQGRTIEGRLADRLQAIMKNHGERLLTPSPVGDPLVELLNLAAEIGELKEIMREQTAELIKTSSIRYTNAKVGEQLRQEVLLYERALERFAKILIDISKLKIEDRLAGVQEATAQMLERALDAALTESGIELEGIMGAKRAFRRQLKVVQGELAS